MEFLTSLGLLVPAALALFGGVITLVALMLRRVVPTNEVHIVQSAKKTMSYGKDTGNGNTYYEWPSWIPFIGITKVKLPMSVFDLDLESYEAYDKDRVPFVVDVKAFFRITDSNVAAQRLASFTELLEQLHAVVQGAARVILASHPLETILQSRSTFGEQFTKEVEEQLANWGVGTVKNIELMDIRDSAQSAVIKNIMEKKKSHIEMESRTEVAKNKQVAAIAEIEAQKEVDLQKQMAVQSVGLRTIEAQREVAISEQSKIQAIKEQERTTKDKEMSILKVQQVRTAEIEREVQVVKAQQNKETTVLVAQGQKETAILNAEAQKDTTTLVAEGNLESKKREAEGIALEGTARAEAEKAMQLAPVQAQITLAKEIGSNDSYQKYLITIRQVEAQQAVGMEQAKALEAADVKVIANTGSVSSGMTSVMDMFTANGGTQLGAMLEGLAQTEKGSKLLTHVLGAPEAKATKANGKANGLNHS
jgi:flotillin